MPPTFVLSQDQTLQQCLTPARRRGTPSGPSGRQPADFRHGPRRPPAVARGYRRSPGRHGRPRPCPPFAPLPPHPLVKDRRRRGRGPGGGSLVASDRVTRGVPPPASWKKAGDDLLSRWTHYHRPRVLIGRVRDGNGSFHPGMVTGRSGGRRPVACGRGAARCTGRVLGQRVVCGQLIPWPAWWGERGLGAVRPNGRLLVPVR
jgi:hypothetical protein